MHILIFKGAYATLFKSNRRRCPWNFQRTLRKKLEFWRKKIILLSEHVSENLNSLQVFLSLWHGLPRRSENWLGLYSRPSLIFSRFSNQDPILSSTFFKGTVDVFSNDYIYKTGACPIHTRTFYPLSDLQLGRYCR